MTSLSDTAVMEAHDLKKVLKDILAGEKAWEKENEILLVNSMLEHIGSLDSELRDGLIYGTFSKLILEKELDQELLIEILTSCLAANRLFKGIGETETDTVFTRSFTTLLIALILHRNSEEDFLSSDMVFEIKEKLISYIGLENDLRGFVMGKGWAHSIAHVADAFDELIKNKYIHQDFYLEVLKALWNKALVSNAIYIHDEEERILIPIVKMLNRGLEHKLIVDLLRNIPLRLEEQKRRIEEENYWILYANCKKFLKSFYIKIADDKNFSSLKKSIKTCLLEI
ncbi:uncharacterized protein DUF2785 [Planomicrobium soli]|uniref:Uncharacterized protein DUF2785 n=1 Tax=Planomicrobium soli TaxID=1176648 RepID=A0A2P8GGB3_9BACL|nr:DUF2785 domain-containing protein [Planomicrobium soli]PSL32965.1 uncharacterized protein DUF2785 [Planomicrobium soli]